MMTHGGLFKNLTNLQCFSCNAAETAQVNAEKNRNMHMHMHTRMCAHTLAHTHTHTSYEHFHNDPSSSVIIELLSRKWGLSSSRLALVNEARDGIRAGIYA